MACYLSDIIPLNCLQFALLFRLVIGVDQRDLPVVESERNSHRAAAREEDPNTREMSYEWWWSLVKPADSVTEATATHGMACCTAVAQVGRSVS